MKKSKKPRGVFNEISSFLIFENECFPQPPLFCVCMCVCAWERMYGEVVEGYRFKQEVGLQKKRNQTDFFFFWTSLYIKCQESSYDESKTVTFFSFFFLVMLYYNHGALKSLIQTWTWMVFYSKMKYPLWVERKSVFLFFVFFVFFPSKKIYILLMQNVKARLAVFSSKLQYFLSSNHQLRNGSQS